MDRTRVSSSNIASIGYDRENMVLEVEFLSGSVYQYYHVPESIYIGFMNAPSHGRYLNWNIKGAYRYYRIA